MPTLPGGTLPPTAAAMLSAFGGLQGAPPPKFPAAAPAPMVPAESATLPAMAGVAHAEPSKTSAEPAQTHVSQGGSSRGPSKGCTAVPPQQRQSKPPIQAQRLPSSAWRPDTPFV